MKKIRLTAIMCLLLGAMVSCNKGSGNQPSTTTTDEAADLVTASLAINTSGSITNTDNVTASAQAKLYVDSLCGATWADSVKVNIGFGSQTSYMYNAKQSYTLDCGTGASGLANDQVSTNSVFSGSFTDAILTSSYSGTSAFTIGGLGLGSSTYTINGEYKRSGSFVSKSDTSFEGSHNVDIVLTNLVLNKPLRTIKSGTATFTVSGVMPKRGSFTYTGTVVFNGEYDATISINGQIYLVNLATGAKRKG